jgi:hypothetical protein
VYKRQDWTLLVLGVPPLRMLSRIHIHMHRYENIIVPTHQWIYDNLAKIIRNWPSDANWTLVSCLTKSNYMNDTLSFNRSISINISGEWVPKRVSIMEGGFHNEMSYKDEDINRIVHYALSAGSLDIWSRAAPDYRSQTIAMWWFMVLLLLPDKFTMNGFPSLKSFYYDIAESTSYFTTENVQLSTCMFSIRCAEAGPILRAPRRNLIPTWECLCNDAIRVFDNPETRVHQAYRSELDKIHKNEIQPPVPIYNAEV